MARKKRGTKSSKGTKSTRVRSMKSRKPKPKARRTTRGKYSGGK